MKTGLREPGAPAKEGFIPLCVPYLGGNEWAYVKECLDTNWVSSAGPFVDRFEREAASAVGTKHGVAVVNGTSALHVALLLCGVGPGEEVVVSDLTFIAPANAVRYVGAYPVFVDAEPVYWQMDVQKLKDFLLKDCQPTREGLRNRVTGRLVRAILPVHILGGACDMAPILDLAERYGLPVVEDATEGLGGSYRGKPLGSIGRIGCLSFNGNKILTTGGGGMLVTNDDELAKRARYLTTQAKDDAVEFVHGEAGYNYRLPNILAAMGCAQLERLGDHVARKRAIAEAYTRDFKGLEGVESMQVSADAFSSYWLYTVRIDERKARRGSRDLLKYMESQRIQSRPLWQPMHLSPAHRDAFATDCCVATRLHRECLSLPCSVGLSEPDLVRVAQHVRNYLSDSEA